MHPMKDVVAAIMLRDSGVFVAQRAQTDPLAGWWEFPGGKVEEGESPEQSLRREMFEEFRITVDVGEFFAESIYDYGSGKLRLLAYTVNWSGSRMAPQVHAEIAWLPVCSLDGIRLLPADIPIAHKLCAAIAGDQ